MDKREKGQRGEQMALEYLLSAGYILLARNLRYGHKEIDLIMQNGGSIVFVEVKARTTDAFGAGRESVHTRKQRHLIDAALWYLRQQPPDTPARFDVVEVELHTGRINHLENAFLA